MTLEQREGEDLMNLMCGELLGSGQYRHVYRAQFDSNLVIKYERQNKHRSNIFEHDLWMAFKHYEIGRWLAPCRSISPDGTWLIQAYAAPIRADLLPQMIPAIFCDLKPENWGWFDGRPVCRDYGNNLMYSLARRPGAKLVKAQWHQDSDEIKQRWRDHED